MAISKHEMRTIDSAHEIGHVLLLLKVGHTLKVAKVGDGHGVTRCAEKKNPTGRACQLVTMAGPAAEALWLNEHYRGEFPSWSGALSRLLSARSTKDDRKMFTAAKGPLSRDAAAREALSHIKANRGRFNRLTKKLASKRSITSWDL